MIQYQLHIRIHIHKERIINFLNGVLTGSCLIVQRVPSPEQAPEVSNHSPPSSAEVNNGCICTSALPYDFMMCIVHKLVFSLPYEIRKAHEILHGHWTTLLDTAQCNEPQLHGPAIENYQRGPPQQNKSLPFQFQKSNINQVLIRGLNTTGQSGRILKQRYSEHVRYIRYNPQSPYANHIKKHAHKYEPL